MILVDSSIQGVHAKQGCYLCGNPNRLVDTEVSIDYEGVLAICVGCVKDLAQTAGFNLEIPAAEVERLKAAEIALTAERDSAERALADIKEMTGVSAKRHKERLRKAELKATADASA